METPTIETLLEAYNKQKEDMETLRNELKEVIDLNKTLMTQGMPKQEDNIQEKTAEQEMKENEEALKQYVADFKI